MNIKEIRRQRLQEWFADKSLPTKDKSYISQIITGKSALGEKGAKRLEETYGMPFGYLVTPDATALDGNVSNPQPFSRGTSYPLISWVSAGAWCEAIEPYTLSEILERYESNAHVEGDAFWLRVKGDSMTSPYGQSIAEGMMILVDTGREPKNGSLVVAKLTDANEATFKKLVIDSGLGKKYLQPLNPQQERIEVNGNCKIIGVAIEQRGSLI